MEKRIRPTLLVLALLGLTTAYFHDIATPAALASAPGDVDLIFDAGTISRQFAPAFINTVVVQLDGRILVGGAFDHVNGVQPNADFNISGSGMAAGALSGGVVNAATHFSLGGSPLITAPSGNLFVGFGAGSNNTGLRNSFFGNFAGLANSTGRENSFFGNVAGSANNTGGANSFFGADAGRSNTNGSNNSFFGNKAGDNSFGSNNTFVGSIAGFFNFTGSNNTLIGAGTNVGLSNLTNATAIGANAVVSQSNSLVLGNNANVGIGASSPLTKLHVEGSGFVESTVRSTNERAILSLDSAAGGQRRVWTLESGVFGSPGLFGIYDRTAGQARLVIGPNGNVGIGTSFLGSKLTVDGGITAMGFVRVLTVGVQGNMHLCRSSLGIVAFCSSSLRYKTDLRPFPDGLKFINQLRPISFKWKSDASLDIGFGAEEVARVNPLFVTYNDKGEVEGVKYDRLSVVFVNAIKEQQAQIERQQQQIDELKKLVCHAYPAAEVCKQ